MLETIQINPTTNHRASVIWMHGLGADGHDFESIVPELKLPPELGVRFIFPHAPIRPVALSGGMPVRAWFDIYGLSIETPQDEAGIRQAQHSINQLIEKELQDGITTERIVLAGFSQGGAVALQAGLRYPKRLGGILGLSTYLPLAHLLPTEINTANQQTPLLLAHGSQDSIVPVQWGELSRDILLGLGYSPEWYVYPMMHTVCEKEIQDIAHWLERVLHQ